MQKLRNISLHRLGLFIAVFWLMATILHTPKHALEMTEQVSASVCLHAEFDKPIPALPIAYPVNYEIVKIQPLSDLTAHTQADCITPPSRAPPQISL